MATTVYEVQELVLDDGSTVTCKPANIKVLRKGTEMLDLIPVPYENEPDLDDNEAGIRRMLDVVVLCLKRERPEFEREVEVKIKTEDGEETRKKKVPDYDLLEELFDLSTMFKVIELYLGVKLNDPNLLEAAAQLAEMRQNMNEESLGQSSTSQN